MTAALGLERPGLADELTLYFERLIEKTPGYGYKRRDGGQRVPGVTEIIREAGLTLPGVEEFYTAAGAQRGKDVHLALAQKHLTRTAIPPLLIPWARGFEEFVAETGFRPILVETAVHSALQGYAGRFDLAGLLRSGSPAILDVKTVAARAHDPATETRYQLGGYDMALRETFWTLYGELITFKRFALVLGSEGPPKVKTYTDRNDEKVFTAAATIWKARVRDGRLKAA